MKNIINTPTFLQNTKQIEANYSIDSTIRVEQDKSIVSQEKNITPLTSESVKLQFNHSILQANFNVSVSAGNESLSLLYKTAIEGINDVLKPEFGDNAIQAIYQSGLDVSPEATADRIVTMSTAFFTQYQEQNTNLSIEEAVESFTKIISKGMDQGFAEAREILTSLKVLEGDIATNIDSTYDLVQKGLQGFVDSYTNEAQN
jgi:hypothetical protein